MSINIHWRRLASFIMRDTALVESFEVEAIYALHTVHFNNFIIEEVIVS